MTTLGSSSQPVHGTLRPSESNYSRRLHDELLSNIFLTTSHSLKQKARFRFPYLLLRVCKLWNHVSLATPSLWTYFFLDEWAMPKCATIQRQLQRSGRCLLDIEVAGEVLSESWPVVKALRGSAGRWRSLAVRSLTSRDDDHVPEAAVQLEELTISNTWLDGVASNDPTYDHVFKYPPLKKLHFVNVELRHWESCVLPNISILILELQFNLTLDKLRRMTSTLPHLKELRLKDIQLEPLDAAGFMPIHAPSLRILSIISILDVVTQLEIYIEQYPLVTIEAILLSLWAPQLQTLIVGWRLQHDDIDEYSDTEPPRDWATRFPELRTLKFEDATGPRDGFVRFMRACPHVHHIEIEHPSLSQSLQRMYGGVILSALEALKRTTVHQRLRSVTVHQAPAEAVYRALKGTSVELYVHARMCHDPPTLRLLEDLEGFEIFGSRQE